jgi:hypothetical protein
MLSALHYSIGLTTSMALLGDAYFGAKLFSRSRKLRLHEFGKEATAALQFVKRAALGDAAVAKNQNAAGVADGGKPMRNHKGSAALHYLIEREVHALFG